MFSSVVLAVFSVLCLDMAASAPNRPDDIACKSVTYWDCQSSNSTTKGLPSCDPEEVCSFYKNKTQCRDLPKADKCLNDSGKVCIKKCGEIGRVIGFRDATTTTTTAYPTTPDYDDRVGCTTGEDIVCRLRTEKFPNYPEVNCIQYRQVLIR